MKQSVAAASRHVLMLLLTINSNPTFAQNKTAPMKLIPPQTAPSFTIKNIEHKNISLEDYKGQKVLLTFYRNVGCPVCNLRFHELEQEASYFKSQGLIVLAVYESTPENMKQYLQDEKFYATMIPDPEQKLYCLYSIDKSTGKMMKGMFHGMIGKVIKGNKLFKRKIKQDGRINRISADFLINENGKVNTAYYGKFIGDHLPVAEIKKFLNPGIFSRTKLNKAP